MRYPLAVWVPWLYPDPAGRGTYYKGLNRPTCVVLHVMAGWASTAVQWAQAGMYPKSWHFTVARDGTVYQHLDFDDGGFHAGITATQALKVPPGWYLPGPAGSRTFVQWPLWQGPYINVNHYSIGIEMEGFPDLDRTLAQETALYRLLTWLSRELNIPWEYQYFVPHGVIDRINRVNDFDYPRERVALYQRLGMPGDPLEENMGLTAKELARIERIERLIARSVQQPDPADRDKLLTLTGEDALRSLDTYYGWSAFGYLESLNKAILRRDGHTHNIDFAFATTGPADVPDA